MDNWPIYIIKDVNLRMGDSGLYLWKEQRSIPPPPKNWSFSPFFLLVLIHANLQRKVYFVGGRGTISPETRNGYFNVILSNSCGFVRANVFLWLKHLSVHVWKTSHKLMVSFLLLFDLSFNWKHWYFTSLLFSFLNFSSTNGWKRWFW